MDILVNEKKKIDAKCKNEVMLFKEMYANISEYWSKITNYRRNHDSIINTPYKLLVRTYRANQKSGQVNELEIGLAYKIIYFF